jgi:hypothetical protein
MRPEQFRYSHDYFRRKTGIKCSKTDYKAALGFMMTAHVTDDIKSYTDEFIKLYKKLINSEAHMGPLEKMVRGL